MRLTAGRLLVTVLLVQACATGGGPRTTSTSRTMISSAEVAASGGTNAQEIVDRLRPEWLLTRGDASISGDIRQTLVYLNDQRYGTVAALRDIPRDMIGAIELLTGDREQRLLVGDVARSTSAIIRIIGPAQLAADSVRRSSSDALPGIAFALYPLAGGSPLGERAHASGFESDGWTRSSHSLGGPFSMMASARIPINLRSSLEVLASRRFAEETETFERAGAFVHHASTSTAAGLIASIHAGPVRIGAGPIAQLTELDWAAGECACVQEGSKNVLVGGATLDLAASLPRTGRLSLEMRVQGRWLRDARIHGFNHLPAWAAGGTAWFVGIGAGVNLGR